MSEFLVTLRTKRVEMELSKRYSIAYKGLKNGLHEFDFKVDDALFRAFESAEIRGGTCDVHVKLKRSECMLEIDTVIDGSVLVDCDRCLEEFGLPVHFEGHLIVKLSDEADDYDGEVMWISPAEPELNMMQYIYESIVLSLPYQRVHPDGECDPDMLKRFGIVSGAEFAAIEARAGAEAAVELSEVQSDEWAKLEALRKQMELDVSEALHEENRKNEK